MPVFRRSETKAAGAALEEPEEAQRPVVAPSHDQESRTIVDRHSFFRGKYRSARNLQVEGQMEGEIEVEGTLTIAKEARVKARVIAKDVTVAGSLAGQINCRGRLQVMPTGRVSGSVTAARLAILEGAYYEGELHMARESQEKVDDEGKDTAMAEPGNGYEDVAPEGLVGVAEG